MKEVQETDLSEAEIAARFESTVRRMANTKPVKPPVKNARKPKPDGKAATRPQ